MLQDLRFAWRVLRKARGFTVLAVMAIALGIGANTAIFSLVNALLLRPLPVNSPDRLVWVFSGTDRNPTAVSSYPDFIDFKQRNTVFSDMLAYGGISLRLATRDQTEIISGAIVTGNYFDMLGVKPAIGRTFAPDEDRAPMASAVAVLQHDFWIQRFAGRADVIGQTLMLNGRPFTIIGIAPQGFRLNVIDDIQVYVPMMMQELARPPRGGFAGGDANLLDKRGPRWLTMVGRLKPGVTLEQAQANVSAIARQLQETYPDTNANIIGTVRPAAGAGPSVRQTLIPAATLLMLIVAAVLMIACANVANMMLARVLARRHEIAVRLSLGSSRARLVRQLTVEGALISCIGGAVGLASSVWFVRMLLDGPVQKLLPIHFDVSVDFRVLVFTMVLSIMTGIIFGLVPAFSSFKSDIVRDLKTERSNVTRGGMRTRNTLVAGQLAISVVLLIGAGLFLRSFLAAHSADVGFDASKLVTMPMNINLLGYNRQQSTEFYRQAIERVEQLLGVESASMARVLMLSGSNRTYSYFPQGTPAGPESRGVSLAGNVVGLKFFKTLGIPLVRGRDFTEEDRAGGPGVVIINETMARQEWREQDPIGKILRIAGRPSLQVIGVVQDAKYLSVQESPRPYIYLPLFQNFETGMTLHVRTESNTAGILASVRSAVQSIDRNLPITDVHTMEENVSASLAPARLGVVLIGMFAVLALLLAAIGAYAAMSYAVAQRSREIGIRMALGANSTHVLRSVVVEGVRLAVFGLAIGIAISVGVTRFAGSMLFGVSPTDPVTFAVVGLILIAVSALASYIPARRAAGIDPMRAVREE